MPSLTETIHIDVGDGQLAVDFIRQGSDDDRPVIVFLHGWTLDRRMWSRQVEPLSENFRLLMFDRRGFGQSTAPPSLSREVKDLTRLLDHFGIETAVILGMSQAGLVAACFAARHPDRVSALILQGSNLRHFIDDVFPAEMPLGTYAEWIETDQLDRMKDHWRDHALMRLTDASHQPLVEAMLDGYNGQDLVRPSGPKLIFTKTDLVNLSRPVLSIIGDQDTEERRLIAKAIADRLEFAELAIIPGAGHMCNLCCADLYNEIITDFVTRLDGGAVSPRPDDCQRQSIPSSS